MGYVRAHDLVDQKKKEGLLDTDRDSYALSVFFTAIVDGLVLADMIDPEEINIDAIASESARILLWGIGAKIR